MGKMQQIDQKLRKNVERNGCKFTKICGKKSLQLVKNFTKLEVNGESWPKI